MKNTRGSGGFRRLELAADRFLDVERVLAIVIGESKVSFGAPAPPTALEPSTQLVGHVLFGEYMLPFEIASILLLVAMIGAVVMAKKKI